MRLALLTGVPLAALALACESAPTIPEPLILELVVAPEHVVVGFPVSAYAVVVRKDGSAVSPAPSLDWQSRDATVVSVDTAGRIMPLKAGVTWVVVRVRSQPAVADSFTVYVIQPLSP